MRGSTRSVAPAATIVPAHRCTVPTWRISFAIVHPGQVGIARSMSVPCTSSAKRWISSPTSAQSLLVVPRREGQGVAQEYRASISSAYLAWMPRRLSLEVGVSSSESGSHSSPRICTFFTRSALLNGAMTSARPCSISASTSGFSASDAEVAIGDAVLRGPRRRGVGVEHDQRADERSLVADGAGLADERDHLQRRLEVGRADVLAAGGDDQLLLAVDDPEVAVVVELADVAGVQPAVVVERLGGLLRLVEVAEEDVAAPADHLAVLGERHLDAGHRRADRARLHLVGRPGHRAGALGHAVDLRQRHADRPEPGEQLGRDRRGAGDGEVELVEAEHLADAAEGHVVEELPGGPSSSVASSHAMRWTIGLAASTASSNCRAFSGRPPRAPTTPAWIFSHTRGTPNRTLGWTSRA